MKQILITALMLLSVMKIVGQTQEIDSLKHILDTQALTSKGQLDIYEKLCMASQHNDLKALAMYAEKGLQLAQKEGDKAMIADFHRCMGMSYELYGKTDTALIYYKKGVELAVEANNQKCEAMIYRHIGSIYIYNSQYNDSQAAMEYYLKSLQIFESLDDKKNIALALNSLGECHRFFGNMERAAHFVEQAKALAEEIDYAYGKMCIYYNLGGIADDVNESLAYTSQSLAIARAIGNKKGEIFSLQNLAYDYCLKIKALDKAETYAMECLKMAEEYGESRSLICAWTVLSYVYLYQGRFDECKTMVLNAWETDSLNVQISTLTNLAAAYLYTGEFEKAHSFFVNYVHFMEKNAGIQFQKTVSDMETKYETEKKVIRITSLEKERELYIWLGVAGALMACALGIALWQKIKNAQKEKQLIATRSVLDGEMRERARLARDLHDRLSGNLAAVKIGLNNSQESMLSVYDKLDSCIEEIRRVAHNLMPISLQFGMKVALEDYARQFPNVHFYFFGEDKRVEERTEFVVYCCASELVNNSLRYSGAENINLQLIQDEKYIFLTVQDDGSGYDQKVVDDGFGLKNIRDRVSSCGGKIDIITSPGMGTETNIEIKTDNIQ